MYLLRKRILTPIYTIVIFSTIFIGCAQTAEPTPVPVSDSTVVFDPDAIEIIPTLSPINPNQAEQLAAAFAVQTRAAAVDFAIDVNQLSPDESTMLLFGKNWYIYTDPAGGYAVEMLGTAPPEISSETAISVIDQDLPAQSIVTQFQADRHMVVTARLPESMSTKETPLQIVERISAGIPDQITAIMGGGLSEAGDISVELIASRPIVQSGHPGHEMAIEITLPTAPERPTIMVIQIYVVGDTLYQLRSLQFDEESRQNTVRFMNSFTILSQE